jgi:hypothetical protein
MVDIVYKKDMPCYKHSETFDELSAAVIENFTKITNKMLEELMETIAAEKLHKTDKETILQLLGTSKKRGFTGELPKISLDLSSLQKVIEKYLKPLKWMLLGKAAGPEVEKVVETLGLKKDLPVGTIFGIFLDAVDQQQEFYKIITGKANAPKIQNKSLKYALDFINDRTGKWVDQSLLGYKNRILQNIQDQIEVINNENQAESHAAYHDLLDEQDLVAEQIKNLKDKQELIKESTKDVFERKISLVKMKQNLKDVTKDYGTDWDRIVNTEFGMASGAGTHMAIMETFSTADDEMLVANVNVTDHRCCEECQEWSRKPDGTLKVYKLEQIKPVGYNMDKKRKDWQLTAATHHPHCLPYWTNILTTDGWKNITEIDGSEQIFSENLDTGLGEWVTIKQIVKFQQETLTYFNNRWFQFACANNHDHVIDQRNKKTFRNNLELSTGSSLSLTLSKWEGQDLDFVHIGSHKFEPALFAKFMGIFLSEGSVSITNKGHWQIKISQEKYKKEFDQICKLMFKCVWRGKEASYIPLYDPDLINYFRQFGYSWRKFIPIDIKKMNQQNIELFLLYFAKGDGSIRPGRGFGKFADMKFQPSYTYFTSSFALMSDLCQLLLKVGASISVSLKEVNGPTQHKNGLYLTTHPCWVICRKSSKISQIKSMKITSIPYNDFVYGIELDKNHTMFVEQYGKVSLTGNCRCSLVYIPKGLTVDTSGHLRKLNPKESISIESYTGT